MHDVDARAAVGAGKCDLGGGRRRRGGGGDGGDDGRCVAGFQGLAAHQLGGDEAQDQGDDEAPQRGRLGQLLGHGGQDEMTLGKRAWLQGGVMVELLHRTAIRVCRRVH